MITCKKKEKEETCLIETYIIKENYLLQEFKLLGNDCVELIFDCSDDVDGRF